MGEVAERHVNFHKHWCDIGKPELECANSTDRIPWSDCSDFMGSFYVSVNYRIKGDKHWELRQKWIDSGFTLWIEYKRSSFEWGSPGGGKPSFIQDIEYREKPEANEIIAAQAKDLENSIFKDNVDQGSHYRKEYKGIKLDPARICKIYKIDSLLVGQAVKKLLVAGGRGTKGREQDLRDVVCAINRELEMIEEDKGMGEK